jgi:hypothetical protein
MMPEPKLKNLLDGNAIFAALVVRRLHGAHAFEPR